MEKVLSVKSKAYVLSGLVDNYFLQSSSPVASFLDKLE